MNTPQLKLDGTPYKVFWLGDLVAPSGFGRIGNEVTRRMAMRGWQMVGASWVWFGHPWNYLPFPVIPLGGKDQGAAWASVGSIIQAENPDVVVVCQDFPYSQTAFHNLGVDWSLKKFVIVTPIDGTPIHPSWLQMVDLADATMVISRFGVEAMNSRGKSVELLHPGVDTNEFFPADADEKRAIRERVGIPPDAFLTGSFMMNQGRKAVSKTVEVFLAFAREKPDAWLLLDMESVSPAGWDINTLLEELDARPDLRARVKYRADFPMLSLRERMVMCDVTTQIAHREGFGLPNVESMACKVPPMVLDWCSGSEIAGGGKGLLIRRIPYMEHGTWGGARDAFPDEADWLKKWNAMYHHRDWRDAIATRGYHWAVSNTWDKAADQFEAVLRRVVDEHKKKEIIKNGNPASIPAPGLSDTGDARANATPVSIDHRSGVQQSSSGDPVRE